MDRCNMDTIIIDNDEIINIDEIARSGWTVRATWYL